MELTHKNTATVTARGVEKALTWIQTETARRDVARKTLKQKEARNRNAVSYQRRTRKNVKRMATKEKGRNLSIGTADSLCSPVETNATLQRNYTPINILKNRKTFHLA